MPPKETKKVKINGEVVELYYINELAYALGRTPQTIRKWEIAGVIPKTPFKDAHGRRLYTKEHIEAIVKIAEECGIKQGYSIANTSFSSKVHRVFTEINNKYLKKE